MANPQTLEAREQSFQGRLGDGLLH